jgi:hypothetical protein
MAKPDRESMIPQALCRVDDLGWVTWIKPSARYGVNLEFEKAPPSMARAALKAAIAMLAKDRPKTKPLLERQSAHRIAGCFRVMTDGRAFEDDPNTGKWYDITSDDIRYLRNAITALTTVLGPILWSTDHSIPRMDGARFIRFVHDPEDPTLRPEERPFAWAVYVCRDTCHDAPWGTQQPPHYWDSPAYYADRNVVIAFHRRRGLFRVIGRELDTKTAMNMAIHGHPTAWETGDER